MLKFGFARWPFEISSGEQTQVNWAGRAELRVALERQIENLQPERPTALVNIWATYGAGKTFAMRYLQHRAREEGRFAIYCVAPGGATGFLAFYKAIVETLGRREYEVLSRSPAGAWGEVAQSIYQASKIITIGNAMQAAEAQSYLSGSKTSARQRKDLAVTADFTDVNVAATALSSILSRLGTDAGIFLLLDEMQDLAEMRDRVLGETVRSFQKVFDEVHSGLRIVTSFTAFNRDTVTQILGPALSSRSSKMLEIPEFTRDEAWSFLHDLVTQAKNKEHSKSIEPFSRASLYKVVDSVIADSNQLLPRPLILAANAVLEEA